MGKNIERQHESEFNEDTDGDMVSEIEYSLDDDEFFEQFEPRRPRKGKRRARDARRRIDEYWEDRILAERLSEYYDDPND